MLQGLEHYIFKQNYFSGKGNQNTEVKRHFQQRQNILSSRNEYCFHTPVIDVTKSANVLMIKLRLKKSF